MEERSNNSTESVDIRGIRSEGGSTCEESYVSVPDFREGFVQTNLYNQNHGRNKLSQSKVVENGYPKNITGTSIGRNPDSKECNNLTMSRLEVEHQALLSSATSPLFLQLRIRSPEPSIDERSENPTRVLSCEDTPLSAKARKEERRVRSLADGTEQASSGHSRPVTVHSAGSVHAQEILANEGGSSPGPKTFKCPQCKKGFKQKHRVREHIRFVHEGVKPFVCKVPGCSRASTSAHANKQHYETVHLRLQQHQCRAEGCEASFGQISHRNRHEYSQT